MDWIVSINTLFLQKVKASKKEGYFISWKLIIFDQIKSSLLRNRKLKRELSTRIWIQYVIREIIQQSLKKFLSQANIVFKEANCSTSECESEMTVVKMSLD